MLSAMAVTDSARPADPGQPLPCIFEIKTGAAIRVATDPTSGLIVVSLAAWPLCRMLVAPEVTLELSLHLVSRVNDLRHGEGWPVCLPAVSWRTIHSSWSVPAASPAGLSEGVGHDHSIRDDLFRAVDGAHHPRVVLSARDRAPAARHRGRGRRPRGPALAPRARGAAGCRQAMGLWPPAEQGV
jgi:hypothetical protein